MFSPETGAIADERFAFFHVGELCPCFISCDNAMSLAHKPKQGLKRAFQLEKY
jgi:hypothetical protein